MDNSAQNPLNPNSTNQTPPQESGLTPPPPTPMLGGLTNTDTIPPSIPESPMPSQSAPITVDQIYAPSTPNDVPMPPVDVPTPPQESLTPQDPVQDLSGIENPTIPAPQPTYQTPPQAPAENYNQAPTYQPVPDYSQQPPNPEFTPQTNTPPTPTKSSPKGFIIGGLIALIVVAAIFAVLMFASKNNNSLPKPSAGKATPTNAAIPTTAPTEIPLPTIVASPSAAPTPKTVETFINSIYKYKFDYALTLPAPKKIEADPVRFPKALEVVNLALSGTDASTSAYFIVWDKVNDVPKYITDGQSQFVKVNLYTTNRFTIKKPDLSEETHYLTQKFEKTYDIMLQSAAGKISNPTFEKILNSFTFIEEVSAAQKTASPTALVKPSPTAGL